MGAAADGAAVVGAVRKVNQLVFPSCVSGALAEHRPKMRRIDSYRDDLRRVLQEVCGETFEIQHGEHGAIAVFGCSCRIPHDQKSWFVPSFCERHRQLLEPERDKRTRIHGHFPTSV